MLICTMGNSVYVGWERQLISNTNTKIFVTNNSGQWSNYNIMWIVLHVVLRGQDPLVRRWVCVVEVGVELEPVSGRSNIVPLCWSDPS